MMNHFFLPFRGVFCRVSPIAFDGTLSLLELICKLQYYVNELADNLNDLETALEEFEQYVETALEGKQDVLTWDETPTADSTNPVYSRGIKRYVDIGLSGKQDVLTWDETPTANSNNPVYSKGIKSYVDTGLALKQDLLTWDSTPTNGSLNPVTSDGIYDALAGKQDTLTFDDTPTNGSLNPVTSDGVYDALALKQDKLSVLTLSENNGTYSVDVAFALIRLNIARGTMYEMHYMEMNGTSLTILEHFRFDYMNATTIVFSNSRNTVTIHDDNTVTVS